MKEVLQYLNIFFATVFTLEMALKWFGLGFTLYFKNPWNWLDFLIVIVSEPNVHKLTRIQDVVYLSCNFIDFFI
jgi:hypothetical protein